MVDYSYYAARFNLLSEDEFTQYEALAKSFIDTRGRTNVIEEVVYDYNNSIDDVRIEPYKNAICAVAEKFQMKATTDREITSVSNDGYSETYTNSLDDELIKAARFYLKGTGIWGAIYV